MNTIRRCLFCFLLVMAFALVQSVAVAAGLEVQSAWIRAAPPTAPVMAGYVTLVNRTQSAMSLVGVASDAFGAIEVHEMRNDEGVMRMRALPQLLLPAGETVALKPGGLHLMLMRPARSLVIGDRVGIEFELSDGTRVPVGFEVRAAAD